MSNNNYSKEDKDRLNDGRHKSEEDTSEKDKYKQYEQDAKEDVRRGWGRKAGS